MLKWVYYEIAPEIKLLNYTKNYRRNYLFNGIYDYLKCNGVWGRKYVNHKNELKSIYYRNTPEIIKKIVEMTYHRN